MKRLILLLLILIAAGLACNVTTDEAMPTDIPTTNTPPAAVPDEAPIPADTLTPEATEELPLPDLTSSNGIIARGFDGTCLDSYSDLIIDYEFCVENIGRGDAGPFAVIDGDWVHEFDGLAAGARECVIIEKQEITSANYMVDARNEVEESDETNNYGSFNITPSPPPLCTPASD